MFRRSVAIVALLGSGVLSPADATAEEAPTATMRYQPPAVLGDCPSESELRDAVSARLGYVPFVEDAGLQVTVRIEHDRDRRSFRASVEARQDGAAPSERTLTARSCGELGRAVALALSLAIDPLGRGRDAATVAEPPIADEPAGTPPLTIGVSDGRPGSIVIAQPGGAAAIDAGPPAGDGGAGPTRIALAVGAGATANTLPAPTSALRLGVDVRRGGWSAAIEAQLELPATRARDASAGGGEVSAFAVVASVVPCRHVGRWLGCAVLSAGRLHGEGAGVAMTRSATSWLLRGGLRGAATIPLRAGVALRLAIDLVAPLAPVALELDGEPVWRTPSIELAGGVAVVVNLR